jgi:hypothetical protein
VEQIGMVLGAVLAAGGLTLWLWTRHRALRRAQLSATPLLIGEAMNKRGVCPADAEAAGLEEELGAAVALCAGCPHTEGCRAWLADGDARRSPAYCANAPMLDRVAAARAASRGDRPPRVLVVKP